MSAAYNELSDALKESAKVIHGLAEQKSLWERVERLKRRHQEFLDSYISKTVGAIPIKNNARK